MHTVKFCTSKAAVVILTRSAILSRFVNDFNRLQNGLQRHLYRLYHLQNRLQRRFYRLYRLLISYSDLKT